MEIKEILERELNLINKVEEKKGKYGISLLDSISNGEPYLDLIKEILNYKRKILKMLTAIKVKEIEQGANRSVPITPPCGK
ncbi:MAG: hypothetical protein LBV62_02695 [Rickettsiales bacterium]|jgi:hypothetical protein|nr:hypothetical protein [Rickettsiales bacterium]